MTTLYFYDVKQKYGEFSNFYGVHICINGKQWKTVEHYFQAMKFDYEGASEKSLEYSELIRNAPTANIAKILANQKRGGGYPWRTKLNSIISEYLLEGVFCRVDWNEVKDKIMYEAVFQKFVQNNELLGILQSTGNKELVEHTTRDTYWGDGGDGSGLNKLGIILMRVRDELNYNKIEL